MSLSLGTALSVFMVTSRIGEGGLDDVYEARDTTLDRDVALKVLPAASTVDSGWLSLFERAA